MRNRQRIRVAGVKIATQTPPVKSGQRIIFLSLDDGTGIADATFFESVHERCAWTVFHSWLLLVEGTVHRAGRRGISINAERTWDLRTLMHGWRDGLLEAVLAQNGPDAAQRASDRRTDGDGWDEGSPARIEGAQGRSGLRLPPSAPRQPGSPGAAAPAATKETDEADGHRPPRKLWHSSGGSAGA
jgi:error-prone DNA polymerase